VHAGFSGASAARLAAWSASLAASGSRHQGPHRTVPNRRTVARRYDSVTPARTESRPRIPRAGPAPPFPIARRAD